MKIDISKEWCEEKGKAEDGHEIGAGTLAMDPQPVTITGTQFIEAAVHAQAMADALNTAYWLEAAGDNDVWLIGRLNEAQDRFDKLRSLLTRDDNG